MKANELRLKNLILHDGVAKEVIALADEDIVVKDFAGKPDSFEPIELTEEWLVKFGFRPESTWNKDEMSFNISLNNKNAISINPYDCSFCVGANEWTEWTFPMDIFYVHQLQNLYFALTGEELTLQEEVKP